MVSLGGMKPIFDPLARSKLTDAELRHSIVVYIENKLVANRSMVFNLFYP